HLHVLEADTGAVGERHPVAGADIAVRGEGVHAAESAGREDHRLRGDRIKATGADVECDHADTPAVFDQQRGHECLVVASDRRTRCGYASGTPWRPSRPLPSDWPRPQLSLP